jgi:hypothetical protein
MEKMGQQFQRMIDHKISKATKKYLNGNKHLERPRMKWFEVRTGF